MRPFTICLAAVVVLLGVMESRAGVITFDDLPAEPGLIPDSYGGFNWDHMGCMDGINYEKNPSGYETGVVSPNNMAYNSSAKTATVSGDAFHFVGAYLTGAWNNGLNIDVKGYSNGVEQYSRTVTVDSTGPTWFDFNYLNVDQLTFSSYGGTDSGTEGSGRHFAMDNFTCNAASIPEPSSLTLLLLGAVGLFGYAMHRKGR